MPHLDQVAIGAPNLRGGYTALQAQDGEGFGRCHRTNHDAMATFQPGMSVTVDALSLDVNRGAPWNARAYAPTMTKSTARARSNAQNSLKSGARSNESSPKKLYRREALLYRTRAPIRQRPVLPHFVGRRSRHQRIAIETKLHAVIVAGTCDGGVNHGNVPSAPSVALVLM